MPDLCPPGEHRPGYPPTDQDVEGVDVATATDREWHLNPAHPHAFCGGCGMDAVRCHPGFCCTDVEGWCNLCADRYGADRAVVRR